MVKQSILSIPFQLGYRGDVDPRSLPDGATADCANLLFDRQSLRVRPGFTASAAAPVDTRQLAEYANPAYTLTAKIRLLAVSGSDGTFASGQMLDTTVDGSNPVRLAQYGEALYLVDGAATTPVKKALYSEEAPTTVLALTETSAPTSAPVIAQGGGAGKLAGVCQFCYSFAHPIPGTTLISESALSPAGMSGNLAANASVTVTTATTTPGDYVYLYQQDAGEQWRQIAQTQVTTRAPHQAFNVTAPPASDAALYAPTSTVPPFGCSLLLAHGNRMWYAGGDTLYISNLDNPDLVPQSLTVNADPTSGGFIRIGEDGGPTPRWRSSAAT